MSDSGLLADLRTLPHFRTLPEDLLGAVAGCARRLTFSAGQTIFLQGQPSSAFYSVRCGAVKVFRLSPDGREQVLHHLVDGRTFAEAAVLSMPVYPASAVAIEADTRLIEIGAERFLPLFRSEPRLAAAMVSSLSVWLIQMAERVEELSVSSASARLAHYLLRQPSTCPGQGSVVELPMSKKELAAHLAIQPETLSRILKRWHGADLVRTDGRKLEILDERLLFAVADRDDRV